MNNSTSENHHAPWTAVVPLKKIENTKDNLRETDKRPSRDECTIRVFGWDHNGNPIPEEQAQLVDPPKSSSVNSTQQQSLVSSPNMQKTEEKDNKLPWDVVIPHEETEEQTQLVDLPKSSSVNLTQQQSQQTPLPDNYNITFDNNNQAVLPISNPNQVESFSPSYYTNQYPYLTPVDVSAINKQDAFNYLEIEKQREIARIEVVKRRELHDEDLRYAQEKKRLNQLSYSTETPKHIDISTSIPNTICRVEMIFL